MRVEDRFMKALKEGLKSRLDAQKWLKQAIFQAFRDKIPLTFYT